jgi:hypothetical protein
MTMKNLNNIFDILNNPDTDDNLATICIYDRQAGECARFALGFGASDDYSGDEMDALDDRLRAARDYSDIQKILESLPDRYTVSIENLSISE